MCLSSDMISITTEMSNNFHWFSSNIILWPEQLILMSLVTSVLFWISQFSMFLMFHLATSTAPPWSASQPLTLESGSGGHSAGSGVGHSSLSCCWKLDFTRIIRVRITWWRVGRNCFITNNRLMLVNTMNPVPMQSQTISCHETTALTPSLWRNDNSEEDNEDQVTREIFLKLSSS